jgi:hypothetical protein
MNILASWGTISFSKTNKRLKLHNKNFKYYVTMYLLLKCCDTFHKNYRYVKFLQNKTNLRPPFHSIMTSAECNKMAVRMAQKYTHCRQCNLIFSCSEKKRSTKSWHLQVLATLEIFVTLGSLTLEEAAVPQKSRVGNPYNIRWKHENLWVRTYTIRP